MSTLGYNPDVNIQLIKDLCTKLINNPIVRDLTICQAILESRLEGKPSLLAYNSCNLFGIKAGGVVIGTANPNYTEMPTKEYKTDGTSYIEMSKFVKNNNLEDSIKQHEALFERLDRYHNLLVPSITFQEAAHLIQEDGYATDPNYSNLLIDMYNKHIKTL